MTDMHRFYVAPDKLELTHNFWVHDTSLLQSLRNAKLATGGQVVLFDGIEDERLYEIKAFDGVEAHLILITDFEHVAAARKVYVVYGLPVRGNHDDLLRQSTQLGVSHFLPIITDKMTDTEFDHAKLTALLQETAEKYGRSDIPDIREPLHLKKAIQQLQGKVELFLYRQGDHHLEVFPAGRAAGLLIAPDGGWSSEEEDFLATQQLPEAKAPDPHEVLAALSGLTLH